MKYKGFTISKTEYDGKDGFVAIARGQLWGNSSLTKLKKKISSIGGSMDYQDSLKHRYKTKVSGKPGSIKLGRIAIEGSRRKIGLPRHFDIHGRLLKGG